VHIPTLRYIPKVRIIVRLPLMQLLTAQVDEADLAPSIVVRRGISAQRRVGTGSVAE
jgi:hypothetical protein